MTSIAMGLSEHVEQLWAAVGAAGILSVGLTYRIGIKSLSLQISLRALTLALIVAFIQLVVSNVWIEMLILLNVELEPFCLLW